MSLYLSPPITAVTIEWARQATLTVNALLASRSEMVATDNALAAQIEAAKGVFPTHASDPVSPVPGQGYLNTSTGKVRVWSGTIWIDLN